MFAVSGLLRSVCYLLFAGCWLLCVVNCVLPVACMRYVLSFACCLRFLVCGLLLLGGCL